MIGTAIRIVRKHGLRRVVAACFDVLRVHGPWGGLIHIRRLIVARQAGHAGIRQAVAGSVPNVPSHQSGLILFPRSVLFVGAMDIAQCRKYRILQREEMFRNYGKATVMHSEYRDSLRWRSLIQCAGAVYAYRIPECEEWRELVRESERLGIEVIYDIDDPVFDVKTVASNPNRETLPAVVSAQLLEDARLFLAAMKRVGHVCVSTAGLATLVRRILSGVHVSIVPNGIDAESSFYASEYVKRPDVRSENADHLYVLVSSGSLAHDADFGACRVGLKRFMEDHRNAVLTVCGHANVDGICEQSRLRRYPILSYGDYLRLVADADITLVPLAACDFNEAKSCVRFLDAALCRTLVVASEVGEYRDLITKELCVGVKSPDEWYDVLCGVARSPALRRKIVDDAFRYVYEERNLQALWSYLDAELINSMGLGQTESEGHGCDS